MTAEPMTTALVAVLESLTLVREQLDALGKANARLEQSHTDIMARLDTIDAGQASVTDLLPLLETIFARQIEDRKIVRADLSQTTVVAAFAYAAAMGNRAPLPIKVADDPLLERYLLAQPADYNSPIRALVEWRQTVRDSSTAELVPLLAKQYQASPTDTAETRVLRYQLAAITRAELTGRGAVLPQAPSSTIAPDRSGVARQAKSEELSRLWRGGATTALFAEPELAGALDLFAEVQRGAGIKSEEQLSADLASLHRQIASHIEGGERPSLGNLAYSYSANRFASIKPDKER